VPVTVVLRETIIDAQGVAHLGSLSTRAIRSDGSAGLLLGALGHGSRGSRIIELASGSRIQTDELQARKSTTKISVVDSTWFKDPRSNCLTTLNGQPWTSQQASVIGEESISGYRTVKIALGKNVHNWFARDYGCALVKTRMDFGPQQGASEFNLVSLRAGEPQGDLFTVPENFVEGPPSFLIRSSKNCGPDCEANKQRRLAAEDRHYYEHRVH